MVASGQWRQCLRQYSGLATLPSLRFWFLRARLLQLLMHRSFASWASLVHHVPWMDATQAKLMPAIQYNNVLGVFAVRNLVFQLVPTDAAVFAHA